MRVRIIPDLIMGGATAFFTGKDIGADPALLAKELGLGAKDIYLPIQKHTDKIVLLEMSREPKVGDAVVTAEHGVLVGVQVADCVPVLILDRKRGVVAAVHAGWRGTAAGILKKTLAFMSVRFSCEAGDLLVAIGPSIRGCCYEVDYSVMHEVRRMSGEGDYVTKRGEKYLLDLAAANRRQAVSEGLPESNIWVSGECTRCNPDRFYSYRRAKGPTGRQGGFIGRLTGRI